MHFCSGTYNINMLWLCNTRFYGISLHVRELIRPALDDMFCFIRNMDPWYVYMENNLPLNFGFIGGKEMFICTEQKMASFNINGSVMKACFEAAGSCLT